VRSQVEADIDPTIGLEDAGSSVIWADGYIGLA